MEVPSGFSVSGLHGNCTDAIQPAGDEDLSPVPERQGKGTESAKELERLVSCSILVSDAVGIVHTTNPNCIAMKGDMKRAQTAASSTCAAYLFVTRDSAPQAEMIRILARVSLAIADDLASA